MSGQTSWCQQICSSWFWICLVCSLAHELTCRECNGLYLSWWMSEYDLCYKNLKDCNLCNESSQNRAGMLQRETRVSNIHLWGRQFSEEWEPEPWYKVKKWRFQNPKLPRRKPRLSSMRPVSQPFEPIPSSCPEWKIRAVHAEELDLAIVRGSSSSRQKIRAAYTK